MGASASAPGKVILAGEYAVLAGHPAVVMAVDRRAIASVTGHEVGAPSAFLAAVARVIAGERGAGAAEARAARRVVVDSSALADGTRKLGLGSSAAATVAATAAALAAAGGALDRALVHRLAHLAHGAAQDTLEPGARGSGLDVAASTYGGTLLVSPRAAAEPAVEPLALPPDALLVPVSTGQPADTRALVAAVTRAARAAPAAHASAIAALAEAASALACACRDADAGALVRAVAAGADAMGALAAATGAPLVGPVHRALAELAAHTGGAAKPTGAGGGDIALAAFADPEAARRFRAALPAAGMIALDLGVSPIGVVLER